MKPERCNVMMYPSSPARCEVSGAAEDGSGEDCAESRMMRRCDCDGRSECPCQAAGRHRSRALGSRAIFRATVGCPSAMARRPCSSACACVASASASASAAGPRGRDPRSARSTREQRSQAKSRSGLSCGSRREQGFPRFASTASSFFLQRPVSPWDVLVA